MRASAVTIMPAALAKDAARLMVDRKMGCLPIVEGEALVGIITDTAICPMS
jgi:CBS domain-containing protein